MGLLVVIACAGCGGGGDDQTPEPRTVTIVLAGSASEGSVFSASGLDCGSACSLEVPPGVIVQLSAVVPPGVVFMGWDGGGCTGTDIGCNVTILDDVTVTATFDQKLETIELPTTTNHDLDLLIVNANDVSTLEEQNNLKLAIPAFLDVLRTSPAGMPDLHIGVVTSDMGALGVDVGDPRCSDSDQGRLVKGDPDGTGQCPMITDNFISALASGSNFTGPLTTAVNCMLSNGMVGCSFEQHLESMHAALNGNPANAGFLRPGALLAVLIRSDQDDCSAIDPGLFGPESAALGPMSTFRCFEKGIRCAEGRDTDLRAVGTKTDCVPDEASTYLSGLQGYVDFLHGLKADPRSVIVGVLSGDPAPVEVGTATPTGGSPRPDLVPSCTWMTSQGATVTADPGIRLAAFANAFGPTRGMAVTECSPDYDPQLVQFAKLVRNAVGYPCIDGELYAPDACTLTYSDGTPIPACTPAVDNQPCWRTMVDATACNASPSHLHLSIVDPAPPPNAYVTGTCRIN